MNEHKGHNKLGGYCWTCRANLVAGTPGFPRRIKNDGPRVALYNTKDVVWADSTHDGTGRCTLCGPLIICPIPVHNERYRVKQTGLAKAWDAVNTVV